MATSFPSSLDSFTNPSASDALDSVSVPHADQHANINDAVEALQAKVGVDGSAVTSSLDYKVNDLPAGNVYLDQTAGGDITVGTGTAVIRTTSVTLESGRRYKISVNGFLHVLSTALTTVTRIMDGATRLALHQWTGNTTFGEIGLSMFAVIDGDGSSHTITLDAVSSTGTFKFSKDVQRPAVLLIEDIGPS